jgi:hypothetical protein
MGSKKRNIARFGYISSVMPLHCKGHLILAIAPRILLFTIILLTSYPASPRSRLVKYKVLDLVKIDDCFTK